MPLTFLTPDEANEFTWPVTATMLTPDGPVAQTFTPRFLEIDEDELNAIFKEPKSDIALLQRVLIGWDDLLDRAGKTLPFSASARDQLTKKPRLRKAVVEAYIDAILGGERVEGN